MCFLASLFVVAATSTRAEAVHATPGDFTHGLSIAQLSSLLHRVHQGSLAPIDIPSAAAQMVMNMPDNSRTSSGVPLEAPPNAVSVATSEGLAAAVGSDANQTAGRRLAQASGLRAVLLFRKPSTSTGQLVVVKEGLDILRAQTKPFAIVSAVGPTRTGKSSILGRAFLRHDGNENVFEIGAGVTSFTGGVWITSEPVRMRDPSGRKLRVFLIDTEGFSGVGGLTSRTYEANLFGISYLLSSALIFNSMFPVDASTVSAMNSHCNHALQMLKSLKDAGVWTHRHLPKFLWSVQSFNVFNLQNTGFSADEMLSSLKNASGPSSASSGAVSALLGSQASPCHFSGSQCHEHNARAHARMHEPCSPIT